MGLANEAVERLNVFVSSGVEKASQSETQFPYRGENEKIFQILVL